MPQHNLHTRAVLYLRVSSEMQLEGYSLDAQLTICRKLAGERGWEIVSEYIEEGVSAKTTERPRFRELLRDAQSGRFDVVIVHKLDRFSRSVVDVLGTLHDLEALHVSFVSATEQFDFTTPMGRVMLTMLAAFAQWYLDNLSAETSKGKQARAEAGMWNGDVPFGYKVRYKKDGGDGLPYVDEYEAEGMRLAFQEYAKGDRSDNDIARLLNEAGYRPHGRGRKALALFSKDTLTAMLQNRFYIGEVQYQDKWLPGLHEPLIIKELFEKCQAVRQQRAPTTRGLSAREGSRDYPLTGLIHCARCGTAMRGTFAHGTRYYRDPAREHGHSCTLSLINSDRAEAAVGAALSRLTLPVDWQERVLNLVESQLGEKRDLAQEKTKLTGQLERLKILFTLGDLTEREYLADRDRLRAQLTALTPPAMPDLERAAALIASFDVIWNAASLAERGRLIKTLLAAVHLDQNPEREVSVRLVPKKEFAMLFDLAD